MTLGMKQRGAATLAIALFGASQATAWTAPATRRRGRTALQMSRHPEGKDLVSVPIPGLDGRETTIRRHEFDMLQEAKGVLPANLGVGGTHVIFLPGAKQDSAAFDTALGTMGVLGLHAMCIDMPAQLWGETDGRLRKSINSIKEHLREKHVGKGGKGEKSARGTSASRAAAKAKWPTLMDTEMLGWALEPVFQQLERESSSAGLPACDHLLLVGCDDGAWVLQAFLCELDRLGLTPRLDISMVALGSQSDSTMAKAVNAVYPNRLPNVRYLNIQGQLPMVMDGKEEKFEEVCGDSCDVLAGLESMFDSKDDEFNDDLASQEELRSTDGYGYGPGYGGMTEEAMTCITSIDGMTEECILSSPEASLDSVESWYSSPATIVRWIARHLRHH